MRCHSHIVLSQVDDISFTTTTRGGLVQTASMKVFLLRLIVFLVATFIGLTNCWAYQPPPLRDFERVVDQGNAYFYMAIAHPPKCILNKDPKAHYRNCYDYKFTGLYKNDGSDQAIWVVGPPYISAYRESNVYISDDGDYVSFVSNFMYHPASVGVLFFKKGQFIRKHYISELLSDPAGIYAAPPLRSWLHEKHFDPVTNRLTVVTTNNDVYEFDITTGDIVKKNIPKYYDYRADVQLVNNKRFLLLNISHCGRGLYFDVENYHPHLEREALLVYPGNMRSSDIISVEDKEIVKFSDIKQLNVINRNKADGSLSVLISKTNGAKSTYKILRTNQNICGRNLNNQEVTLPLHDVATITNIKRHPRPPAKWDFLKEGHHEYKTKTLDNQFAVKFLDSPNDHIVLKITVNGGRTWRSHLLPYNVRLYDVVFDASRRHWWAVGSFGIILYSSDRGITWKRQASGSCAPLEKIEFDAQGIIGTITGRDGTVLKSFDGGQSWSVETPGNPDKWSYL